MTNNNNNNGESGDTAASTVIDVVSERTPLLIQQQENRKQPAPGATIHDGDLAAAASRFSAARLIYAESAQLFRCAWPASLGHIVQMLLNLLAILVLGWTSTQDLAAMALATLFFNGFGVSVGMGMACALDTLLSQAHGEFIAGRAPKKAMGAHLYRGIFVLMVLCVPIMFLWYFTEPLLILIGQDTEVSRLAGDFTWWFYPGLVAFMVSEAVTRFLQSQGIMAAQLVITIMVMPVHVLITYLLVLSPLAVGPVGSSIAVSISWCLIAILLCLYVAFIDGHDALGRFSWSSVLHVPSLIQFVSLGLPGVLMICSEWWAFEAVSLASGILGPEHLAAMTIILNLHNITFSAQLGLAVAVAVRIGNALGAGWPLRARLAAFTAFGLAFVVAVVNASIVVALRGVWGSWWSEDELVIAVVQDVLPLAGLFQLADGITQVGSGILRGLGRQSLGAALNMAGYYVIGLPLGVALCFHGFQLHGLWVGLTIALVIISFVLVVVVARTEWAAEADKARERVEVEGAEHGHKSSHA